MTSQEKGIFIFYGAGVVAGAIIILLFALAHNARAQLCPANILLLDGAAGGGVPAKVSSPHPYLPAIARIESSNNPFAHNKKDDSRGLYQITPICLKEYNNFHATKRYTMQDLWDVEINTRIATWYLNKRIPQMLNHYKIKDTIENRLIAYNAGISYLINKKPIPKITRLYIAKYRRLTDG